MSTVYQTIELSMETDSKSFQKIFAMVIDRENRLREYDEGYVDEILASKGMRIFFRNSQYKKKVRVLVNPDRILRDTEDIDRLIHKIQKRIVRYFECKYNLNDFTVTGMSLSSDADVGSGQSILSYLNVLHRVGRVKGFSPASSNCLDENGGILWEGNSNAIDILIYDPEQVYNEMDMQGMLRTEVHLTKPRAIREYTNADDPSNQIADLWGHRDDIFMQTLMQVIPYGDFYKMNAAKNIIHEKISDPVMRRKMLLLLLLIPKKKSLLLAQKAMNTRDVEKIMKNFAKINMSPVTIGKRQDAKHLKNLYGQFV